MIVTETTHAEPIFLTAEHVAAELQMHPQTLKRLAKAGVLPARQIGKRWYFSPEALRKYMAAATE